MIDDPDVWQKQPLRIFNHMIEAPAQLKYDVKDLGLAASGKQRIECFVQLRGYKA